MGKIGGPETDGLARQLDSFLASLTERVGDSTAALLAGSPDPSRALRVGDIAPDFALPDQAGRTVTLEALRRTGPVVVTFFRGGWCPFCALSLRALDEVRVQLRELGAALVAISPQTAASAADTAQSNALHFPVLTDAGSRVADRWGLAWRLGAEHQAAYDRLGHPLPRYNGTGDWTLPIPAGFVVARDGRIAYAHVDARINRRLEPHAALDAVRRIGTEP